MGQQGSREAEVALFVNKLPVLCVRAMLVDLTSVSYLTYRYRTRPPSVAQKRNHPLEHDRRLIPTPRRTDSKKATGV